MVQFDASSLYIKNKYGGLLFMKQIQVEIVVELSYRQIVINVKSFVGL